MLNVYSFTNENYKAWNNPKNGQKFNSTFKDSKADE